MNIKETIECFHIAFSHRLASKVDRNFFCLKGGCNLRFYFQSIRYSEDIDFDVHTISVDTLKKNVSKILDDKTFHLILKNNLNIELIDWSDPKQTTTTQRWKVTIKAGSQLAVPTKIEFSRRTSTITGAETSAINVQLTSDYNLQPVILQHYKLSKAIEQKIGALLNRTETQARDIIDLKILKDQISKSEIFPMSQANKVKAIETLMSVSFEDYKSQVWPYLLTNYQEHYGKQEIWNQIQDEVIKFIESQPKSTS